MGALGALLLAAGARRLNWQTLKETLHGTLTISAMIFLILLCSQPFSLAFRASAARRWCTTCSTCCRAANWVRSCS